MTTTPGSAHLNFTMGGLVLVGGAVGYMRKGSMISLVAGVTFGGLLIGSGVLITQGESFKGHSLATGCTGLMTVAMGQRFLSTGKFMPAGMVASLGAAGLAYNVKKAIEWMPEKDGQYQSHLLREEESMLHESCAYYSFLQFITEYVSYTD